MHQCVDLPFFNIFIFVTNCMATSFLLISLLVFSTLAKPQVWVQYPDSQEESQVFQKYFRGIKTGYFVQIGGENPIQSSSTIKLSNWQGLIVESDNQKFALLRDFQSHIITLNLEISNVSGGKSKIQDRSGQSSAIVLGTADLCHKFYKVRPNILIINVPLSKAALEAYDWQNGGCVPDIVYPKGNQEQLEEVLISRNYAKMDIIKSSAFFIHKTKLQFYKKEAQKNSVYLSNKIIFSWGDLCESLSKLLGKQFGQGYNARTHPAYPYFRQPNIINIEEINKYSNMMSDVGINRPLLIMEYDQQQSSIYLGTTNYLTESVNAGNFNFKKFKVNKTGTYQQIYVLDHQKYNEFNVVLKQQFQNSPSIINKIDEPVPATTPTPTSTPAPLDPKESLSPKPTRTKTKAKNGSLKYYLIFGSCLALTLVFFLSSIIFKPVSKRGSQLQMQDGDSTSQRELQNLPVIIQEKI